MPQLLARGLLCEIMLNQSVVYCQGIYLRWKRLQELRCAKGLISGLLTWGAQECEFLECAAMPAS